MRRESVLALGVVLLGLVHGATAQVASERGSYEMPIDVASVPTVRGVLSNGRITAGGFQPRGVCPQTAGYSSNNFDQNVVVNAQAGFAQGEIAAVSFTLPASAFPLKLTNFEMILVTSNATVRTTTQWSLLIWSGTPQTGTLEYEFNSDDTILNHARVGPGTDGVNIQLSVDPNDPDQLIIDNANGSNTFSFGLRVDLHNNQTGDGCFVAPPSTLNAFPATDTNGLSQPGRNWLFAINCGPISCVPNGGWRSFSGLQSVCRPSGDWAMRATYEPNVCPGVTGACCIPATNGCLLLTAGDCGTVGGTWAGPNTTCADTNGNGRADACEAPACVADVDNGSGTGTRDNAVTIEDLLYYLVVFGNGSLPADVDNGSGTGTRDNAVTIEDLLYFLARFAAGC